MCSEELGFLYSILSAPAEDTPRLVYADWLDGLDTVSVECAECNGNEVRPGGYDGGVSVACWRCYGTGYTTDTSRRDRAEFIRVQCESERIRGGGCAVVLRQECHGTKGEWCIRCRLIRRERELLNAPEFVTHGVSNWGLWAKDILDRFPSRSGIYSLDFPVQFTRGFISSVTCTAADWLQHADAIYWHPSQTKECLVCKDWMGRGPRRGAGGAAQPSWCKACKTSTGRIPRPFVPTAQPLERVTLSDVRIPPDLTTFELPKQLTLLNDIATRWLSGTTPDLLYADLGNDGRTYNRGDWVG